MILNEEEALKMAQDKYGQDVFVGDLNQVWDEARRRAKEAGLPSPGEINIVRLDGTTWNDECDCWSYSRKKDLLTDKDNHYWFVLFH